MKSLFKSLLVAGALATGSYAALAQPMGMGGGHPMMGGGGPMGHEGPMGKRGHMDPAKMEAFIAKRFAELKTKLKITASQETAWTTFTAAMKPPARPQHQRPDPAELNKLTTPERIDKMHALRVQHHTEMNAAMEQREAAVKTFYATLAPEQQKVFDDEHARLMSRRGHHSWGGAGRGPGGSAPEAPTKK